MIRPKVPDFSVESFVQTNKSLDSIFRVATEVHAAQSRGMTQKIVWRLLQPAVEFFLSFKQSGPRNRGFGDSNRR